MRAPNPSTMTSAPGSGVSPVSALGEKTLMLLLCDTESLTELARDGLNPIVLPTVKFREVLTWSLAYFGQNDKAPSIDIMKERWASLFEEAALSLDDEIEESMGWALMDLKQTYILSETGKFTRTLAIAVNNANPEDRLDVLGEQASALSKVYFDLQPRTTRMDIRESGPMVLAQYELAASSDGVRGMRIGLEEIDIHFGGIHPGELFVLGGPSGTGKSFMANYTAYHEWADFGRNTGMFTLENSIEMTQLRIACMALGLSIEDLQTGTLPDAQLVRLREWCNDVLLASDVPLHIISPDMVGRSPQAVVQMAKALECESLIVDQLTHLAPVDSKFDGRRNEVSTIVRMLGDQINTGSHRIPCLLLHQINRDGIKRAEGTGRLIMTDFAESSEVERTASAACSLYQSREQGRMGLMGWQTLKVRRVKPKHWDLDWAPWNGSIHVDREVTFGEEAQAAPGGPA